MAWARRITPWGPSRYETLGNSTVSFMARSIYPQVLAQVEATPRELGRRAVDDHTPAVQHDDVVGDVEHELGVLLHEHDRESLRLQSPDGGHHLADDLRRQALRRLVHQEHARVRHQGAPDREHLLLAARERAGDLLAALAQPREKLGDRIERPQARPAVGLSPGHGQVLAYGQAAKDAPALRHQ